MSNRLAFPRSHLPAVIGAAYDLSVLGRAVKLIIFHEPVDDSFYLKATARAAA